MHDQIRARFDLGATPDEIAFELNIDIDDVLRAKDMIPPRESDEATSRRVLFSTVTDVINPIPRHADRADVWTKTLIGWTREGGTITHAPNGKYLVTKSGTHIGCRDSLDAAKQLWDRA
jgi:hypothetical protein